MRSLPPLVGALIVAMLAGCASSNDAEAPGEGASEAAVEEGTAPSVVLASGVRPSSSDGPVRSWTLDYTAAKLKPYLRLTGADDRGNVVYELLFFDFGTQSVRIQIVRTIHANVGRAGQFTEDEIAYLKREVIALGATLAGDQPAANVGIRAISTKECAIGVAKGLGQAVAGLALSTLTAVTLPIPLLSISVAAGATVLVVKGSLELGTAVGRCIRSEPG